MSSQDLAPVEETPPAPVRPDLIDPVTDTWVNTVVQVSRLAATICETPFVPEGLRGRGGAATTAAILYGREIGLPPMQSLASVHVVKGRPGLYAETMRAMVLQAGHELEIVEMTSARCAMRGRRRGAESWTTTTWTMGDAHQAKLGGENWSKYPRQMLLARCTTEICRAVFPDVIKGMRSVEESDDDYEPSPVSRNGAATSGPAKVSRARGRQQPSTVPASEPPPLPGDTAPTEGETHSDGQSDPGPRPVESAGARSPESGSLSPRTDEGRGAPAAGARSPSAPQTSAPPAAAEPATPPPASDSPSEPQADDRQTGTGAPGLPTPILAPDLQQRAEEAAAEQRGIGPASRQQAGMIMVQLTQLQDPMPRDRRLAIVGAILGRPIESMRLTSAEAGTVIDTLARVIDSKDPAASVEWLLAHRRPVGQEAGPTSAGSPVAPDPADVPPVHDQADTLPVEDPPELPD